MLGIGMGARLNEARYERVSQVKDAARGARVDEDRSLGPLASCCALRNRGLEVAGRYNNVGVLPIDATRDTLILHTRGLVTLLSIRATVCTQYFTFASHHGGFE